MLWTHWMQIWEERVRFVLWCHHACSSLVPYFPAPQLDAKDHSCISYWPFIDSLLMSLKQNASRESSHSSFHILAYVFQFFNLWKYNQSHKQGDDIGNQIYVGIANLTPWIEPFWLENSKTDDNAPCIAPTKWCWLIILSINILRLWFSADQIVEKNVD